MTLLGKVANVVKGNKLLLVLIPLCLYLNIVLLRGHAELENQARRDAEKQKWVQHKKDLAEQQEQEKLTAETEEELAGIKNELTIAKRIVEDLEANKRDKENQVRVDSEELEKLKLSNQEQESTLKNLRQKLEYCENKKHHKSKH